MENLCIYFLSPPSLVYLTRPTPPSSVPPAHHAWAKVERSQADTSHCWLKAAVIPGSSLHQSFPPHKIHLVEQSKRAFTAGQASLCVRLPLGIICILCNMQNKLPV